MEDKFQNISEDFTNKSNPKSTKDTKQNNSNIYSKDKSDIHTENILDFIKKIEEINDIIFIDSEGKLVFFHSAQNTLDVEYLNNLRDEFEYI